MTNRWQELTKIAEDGRLPLDNNATERALRQPIVGRKNYYGCRSDKNVPRTLTIN